MAPRRCPRKDPRPALGGGDGGVRPRVPGEQTPAGSTQAAFLDVRMPAGWWALVGMAPTQAQREAAGDERGATG